MPEICRFYGIIIAIYFADHNPPHFHARSGDEEIRMEIPNLSVRGGSFPPNQLKYVKKWAKINLKALKRNWELAKANKRLKPIKPLE